MDVLLTGATEKQAARQLGLSVHTVHAYTTILYRAMGVNSRAELLVRCLTGQVATSNHSPNTNSQSVASGQKGSDHRSKGA